jgi:hypothetical protein
VKILFDHCVPKPLGRAFPSHEVRTTAQMGWEPLQNGRLLAQASTYFDVVLTVDKGIRFQQNLDALPIAVVILDTASNAPESLMPLAPFVESVLPTLQVGQMVQINAAGVVTVIATGQ